MAVAGVVLWTRWRSDPDLRDDTRQTVTPSLRFLRRPTVWLSAGVILVGLVLGLGIVIHEIAG